MAQGISLHIGLNKVDPAAYAGWSGELTACEADANDMEQIAYQRGYMTSKLLTNDATRDNVVKKLKDAAGKLGSGDILFLTYSGHGGQLPDLNEDDEDGQDETWCLYDAEIVDDELYELYGLFKSGVRILILSDSCHSGTVARDIYYNLIRSDNTRGESGIKPVYRAMPTEVALKVYRENKAAYDKILKKEFQKSLPQIDASVLLISGCQDNQFSQDGTFNGLFTGMLLRVYGSGNYPGDYPSFHKAILKRMPPDQSPNYYRTGAPNEAFELMKPFEI